MIVQKLNGDGLGRIVQQLEEFQYRFARQDYFRFRQFCFNLAGRISKAVAVGCNKAQLVSFNLHQQAVEVIADILNRHAVLHLRKHGFEGFLSQRESRADVAADIHQRKVFSRQGLQGKAGFARAQSQTVVRPIQRHQCTVRQGAQDVLEFFSVGRNTEIACLTFRAGGIDLDFQVGCQKFGLSVFAFQQHIGQNRQSMATFNNTGNGLQWLEQTVAIGL